MFLGGGGGALVGGGIAALLALAAKRLHEWQPQGGGATAAVLRQKRAREEEFFVCLFSMLGKMAKADGVVSRGEIETTQKIIRALQLGNADADFARQIFTRAKNDGASIEEYAARFARVANPQMRGMAYDLLWEIAVADNRLQAETEELLRRLCRHLLLGDGHFAARKARLQEQTQVATEDSYAVLGCKPTDSDEDIKKAYRRAVSKVHPDRAAEQQDAKEQTQKINDAYRKIRHIRGI